MTLDILTTKLISIHEYSKYNYLANKNDKRVKLEQIALLVKLGLSSNPSGRKPRKGKSNDKSKKPNSHPAGTRCYIYSKRGYQAPKCHSKTNGRNDSHHPKGSTNLAIKHSQSLGEREVGQMLMALSDFILSTSILLNYGITSYVFISYNHFIKYTESLEEFVTVGGHNYVSVVG